MNKITKYKVKKVKLEKDYTQVPNKLFGVKELNTSEKIIITYMMSNSENFKISLTYMSNYLGMDYRVIKNNFNSLVEKKYILITKNIININYDKIINYDEKKPVVKNKEKKPVVKKQDTQKSTDVETVNKEIHSTEKEINEQAENIQKSIENLTTEKTSSKNGSPVSKEIYRGSEVIKSIIKKNNIHNYILQNDYKSRLAKEMKVLSGYQGTLYDFVVDLLVGFTEKGHYSSIKNKLINEEGKPNDISEGDYNFIIISLEHYLENDFNTHHSKLKNEGNKVVEN